MMSDIVAAWMRRVALSIALLGLAAMPARAAEGEPLTWNFEYPANALRDGAMLDLRYLNEKTAGQGGFITRANTGEIVMNYDTGVCTLSAPKVQGVCGFLKKAGGKFKLRDITIETGNDYAAISVVAMDDQPLSQSRKILVQVGTVVRPTGWSTRPAQRQVDGKTYDGQKIVNTGAMPWQVVATDVTLTVRNAQIHRATPLDFAGFPLIKEAPGTTAGGEFRVKLPGNGMYLVLE